MSVAVTSVEAVVGRLLIDGEWVPAAGGGMFEVLDPGTEEVIGQIADASSADVDSAVLAARQAFDDERWLGLSGAQRGVVLWRVADLLAARTEEFARLESRDVGMPVSQAALMVAEAVNQFRYYAGWADKIHGSTTDLGPAERRMLGATYKEPVGVVAMIVPWNPELDELPDGGEFGGVAQDGGRRPQNA
ncbi:aldehyde dehydrogenase family protein, partial [Nocardia beijingensis]|uniref:aldehyde dehydrogenase family protein n=1 Tax=Nocardia beijingensis TaxID=95162 RepID=UPI00344FB4D3